MQNTRKNKAGQVAAIKTNLVAAGGQMTQDFGFQRVAGEVLASLFLTDGPASLDDIGAELRRSKAAVSLAATQLERLGLIQRVRMPGDRKRYYRSADDLTAALRHGIIKYARTRITALEADLRAAQSALAQQPKNPDARFLDGRVARLLDLNRQGERLLNNPLIKLFSKI